MFTYITQSKWDSLSIPILSAKCKHTHDRVRRLRERGVHGERAGNSARGLPPYTLREWKENLECFGRILVSS